MPEIDIKDLTKEPVEEPFFARYLEGQLSEEEQKAVVGGTIEGWSPFPTTKKLLDTPMTQKYPSDGDDELPPSFFDSLH
jgi:hypothetical protein